VAAALCAIAILCAAAITGRRRLNLPAAILWLLAAYQLAHFTAVRA
jgi:hypothetical protein